MAPIYQIGNEVWLLRRYIQTTRPSLKLDFKRLSRFKILETISGYTYKLNLLASLKCHPVLHISLVEPIGSNSLKEHKYPLPTPIVVNDKQKYKVEEVIDSKLVQMKLYYLGREAGHDHTTCKPANYVKNFYMLVRHFNKNNSTSPRPDYLL